MLLRAGPEKCVLATKSYIAKLALLYLVAHELAGKSEEASQNLLQAADEIRDFIIGEGHERIKRLANDLAQKEDLYFIGRGASYADALEGALKIKEVSYIHAEGFAGGELKHGSIALVEEGTPVIVFAPMDETYPAIISNAMEVKARGAFLIGVSPQNNEVFNEWIEVANIPNASNIINIIPMQLLAYYLAIERGCDPDKPRNLAKSVTVR
jgi:glucosamine--fructose-6-phosphate aminotransferase (isomerizing)